MHVTHKQLWFQQFLMDDPGGGGAECGGDRSVCQVGDLSLYVEVFE